MSESRAVIVGVVADTHGLLRPELLEVFNDVDLIIHAGDVGKEVVLKLMLWGAAFWIMGIPELVEDIDWR